MRLSETRDPLEERFGDQRRALMGRERPRDDEAAVVVEEDREVDAPALAAQHVAGDVGLPQLARSRSLETPRRLGSTPRFLLRRGLHRRAGLAQYVSDRAGRHAQREVVGYALAAVVRMLLADAHDLHARRVGQPIVCRATPAWRTNSRLQPLGPLETS